MPIFESVRRNSNIVGGMPHIDSDTFINALIEVPLVAQPGTAFRYGYSTDVLGMIVETIDGVPLGQSLNSRILDPLGMTETSFEVAASEQGRLASAYPSDAAWHGLVPEYGIRRDRKPWMESGGGGLISTLGDYAAFARMLSNGGCIGNGRLLSESLFADMRRNQLQMAWKGRSLIRVPGLVLASGLPSGSTGGHLPCHALRARWHGPVSAALQCSRNRARVVCSCIHKQHGFAHDGANGVSQSSRASIADRPGFAGRHPLAGTHAGAKSAIDCGTSGGDT